LVNEKYIYKNKIYVVVFFFFYEEKIFSHLIWNSWRAHLAWSWSVLWDQ